MNAVREPDDLLPPDHPDAQRADAYVERGTVVMLPGKAPPPPLADTFAGLLQPWNDLELIEAESPWPHVFAEDQVGMFPIGEVSIVASAGREGKTTVMISVATALVAGYNLAGLSPPRQKGSVIVYSAEDDRRQYARKVGAQMDVLGDSTAVAAIRDRLLVPDLDHPDMANVRTLVTLFDGQPMPSGTVEAIIMALQPLMTGSIYPPQLLLFETASTLSEADENNQAFRALILALRRIARELNVAVVLSHHVSQASLAKLPDLDLSTADIRGATTLVNNSRQTAMLVNLGSNDDPFPEADARTVLRKLVAPGEGGKVTALVTLDSSKSITPAPVFFRWEQTKFGPAAIVFEPTSAVARKPWRKVMEMVRAKRAEAREEAKEERRRDVSDAAVDEVVRIVRELNGEGRPATSNAVATHAGRGQSWPKPYLAEALLRGLLRSSEESIPRVRGSVTVFHAV